MSLFHALALAFAALAIGAWFGATHRKHRPGLFERIRYVGGPNGHVVIEEGPASFDAKLMFVAACAVAVGLFVVATLNSPEHPQAPACEHRAAPESIAEAR